MSKYTTEVRYICEMAAGLSESTGFDNVGQVLHSAHNSVIGDYPIFDEAYRETLNTKILRHYYTREICEETVGLWKLRLNSRMNEIMPYYNKLYSSELLNFNPFYDVDLTTDHLRNEDTEGNLISKTKDDRNDSKNTGSEVERNGVVNNTREDETARNSNTETMAENQNASTNRNETHSGVNGSVENQNASTNRNETHSGVNGSVENQNASTNRNETHSGVNASTENSDTKNQKDKYSDTPQGGITGLESGTYLTNARIIDATETGRQQTNQQTDALGSTEYNENGRQQTNQQTDALGSTEYNENGKQQTSQQTDTLGSTEYSESVSSKDSTNSSGTEHFNTVGKSENKDSTKTATSETLNSNANGERTDENTVNTTEDYLEHVQGKRGGMSFSKMLSEYRETFLNIDRMIIDELSDLFFGLWD